MYTFDSRVRYSEVGENKKLTLTSILNYFQDCSTFHSESLGVGLEFLENMNRVWVLNSWQVVVERYAKLCEEIEIQTWPTDFNGVLGTRSFVMKTKAGELLAYANTLWSFLDTSRGRLAKVPEVVWGAYELEAPVGMASASRKIPLPEQAEPVESFQIQQMHLDTNHHVNNAQYVELAREYLPTDFEIFQMRAEYKKSALLGDVIYPWICAEGNCVTVALCDEGKKPYAAVEFLTRTC